MKNWLLIFLVAATCYGGEQIPHECGVALIRLRKPIAYYQKRYQDPAWGMKKLLYLMEKQRNRGQDGAGIALMQFNMALGHEYFHQFRSASGNALDELTEGILKELQETKLKQDGSDEWAWKKKSPYIAEALLGHLRYGTYAGNDIKCCQPFVRSHYVPSCQFALAGNFNMTNTPYLSHRLDNLGLSLTNQSDTQIILDSIAYQFDQQYHRDIKTDLAASSDRPLSYGNAAVDIVSSLKSAAKDWDGGYVFCGIVGSGDVFACRDPAGIRPGFVLITEEVVAVASERVSLAEAFGVDLDEIAPIQPGHVIVVKKSGEISDSLFTDPLPEKQCTFERIYFSKPSDPEIYKQRKALGRQLAPVVFDALGKDLKDAIFTYVPNSSISAFQGLVEEIAKISHKTLLQKYIGLGPQALDQFSYEPPRVEYIIAKNQKIRTFISSEQKRGTLVRELYEVTQGIVGKEHTLVVVDDSIVRGTTLQESLLPKLIKLNPKKIIIVSSAPPVMYPDCYGIDMSQLGRFIAFQAAVSLLKERNQQEVLKEVQALCLQQIHFSSSQMQNGIKKIYAPFSQEEISRKIAELITPPFSSWDGSIQVIYQSLEGLHEAMPGFTGDWYFSGNYPTPGGVGVLNNSFLKWLLGDTSRSY